MRMTWNQELGATTSEDATSSSSNIVLNEFLSVPSPPPSSSSSMEIEVTPLHVKNKHELDDRIVKHEEEHRYFLDGQPLKVSVTALVKIFADDFDKDRQLGLMFRKGSRIRSKKPSIYANMSAEAVDARWAASADEGTNLHKALEELAIKYSHKMDKINEVAFLSLMQEEFKKTNTVLEDHITVQLCKILYVLFCKWEVYRTEWVIVDAKNRIGGTIDLVLKSKEGDFLIVDYKKKVGDFRSTKQHHHNCRYPFENKPANKISEYQIQTSFYAHMLRTCYNLKVAHAAALVVAKDQVMLQELPLGDVTDAIRVYDSNERFKSDIKSWHSSDSMFQFPHLREPAFKSHFETIEEEFEKEEEDDTP